jgi:beta-barrel assembly-enhancing protease
MQKTMNQKFGWILNTVLFVLITSCDKDTGLNFFTLNQDIEFGETMDSIIRANPADYPILEASTNPDAYDFINGMMQKILQSDDFVHKADFDWEVTIIEQDVMNAFAVPGGKLYFYTGLIKYLDNAADLAGVMAHEMAHADRRHSTEQMTKYYGLSILVSLLLGDDKSQFEEIASDLATGLAALQFSRTHEYEADEYAVRFTTDTDYHPKGIAGFFEKLQTDGQTAQTFEFLSTHPSDQNRIDNIDMIWRSLGSPGGAYFETEYTELKSILP